MQLVSKKATATNAAATITIAAVASTFHMFQSIEWSYSSAPTGGRLTVTDSNSVVYLDLDITAAGPGSFRSSRMLYPAAGVGLTVTLAAGGGGIVGKVNLMGYRN